MSDDNTNVVVTSDQIQLIMANYGLLCKRINMIKTSSNQPCGRDSEC